MFYKQEADKWTCCSWEDFLYIKKYYEQWGEYCLKVNDGGDDRGNDRGDDKCKDNMNSCNKKKCNKESYKKVCLHLFTSVYILLYMFTFRTAQRPVANVEDMMEMMSARTSSTIAIRKNDQLS